MQQTEFQEGIYAEILKTISLKQVRDKKSRGNVSKNENQTNYRYEKLTA